MQIQRITYRQIGRPQIVRYARSRAVDSLVFLPLARVDPDAGLRSKLHLILLLFPQMLGFFVPQSLF